MKADSKKSKALDFSHFLLVALLLSMQALLSTQLRNMEAAFVELPTERNYKWDARLFKSLSFGLWPLVVDWMWVRTLSDQTLFHVADGAHPPAYYDFDLATDLDPAFFEIYAYGSNYLAIIRDDNRGAADLLLKGQRFRKESLPQYPEEFRTTYWKGEWWVPLTLAYLYLFELDDIPAASEAFREASNLPRAPSYLRSLAARLESPEGQYEVGLRILGHMLLTAKDGAIREKIRFKQMQLQLGQYVHHLNRSFLGFLEKIKGAPKLTGKPISDADQKRMTGYWNQYRKSYHVPERDPFGGTLSINRKGEVVSNLIQGRAMGMRHQ